MISITDLVSSFLEIILGDWSSGGLSAPNGIFDFARATAHNFTDEYFVSFGLKFE